MRRIFSVLIGAATLVGSAGATGTLGGCDAGDDTVSPLAKKDAGNDATTGDGGDGGGGPVDTSSLCFKYGGFTKVDQIAQAIVKSVSADCRIGAYFTNLALIDKTHFSDCLARQLGEFMGCANVTYTGSHDSLGAACRSMSEAHRNVDPQITQGDFQVFVVDVVNTLKASGISAEDVSKIAPSFNSQNDVPQNGDLTNGQSVCDAGAAADTGSDAEQDTGSADAADGG